MEVTFLGDVYDVEVWKSVSFLLILNATLWFKFCKRLRVYSIDHGRNPKMASLVAFSPMAVFPLVLGGVGLVFKLQPFDSEFITVLIFLAFFFLVFGSYLISLFWYGGIDSKEKVSYLNGDENT